MEAQAEGNTENLTVRRLGSRSVNQGPGAEWERFLKNSPSVKKFEKLLNRGRITPKTLEEYVKAVKDFCRVLEYESAEDALEYIKAIEDKEDWLDSLIGEMRNKFSDNRIIDLMKGVKKWLILNRIDIDWEYIVLPSKERLVEDRSPTKEELRKILNICNIRDKACILVALSSGLRENALRTLTFGDVNFDYPDVARIIVKRKYEIEGKTFTSGRKISKQRSSFVTFITPEAKNALLEYKDWRIKEGETITEKSPLFTSMIKEKKKTAKDKRTRLGSFLAKRYLTIHWENLLKKAHLADKSGKWYTIHLHTLKAFANQQFKNVGVKESYKEFWLGHKGGYLDTSYFKPDLSIDKEEESKHLEEYRKAIPQLELRETAGLIEESIRLKTWEDRIVFDMGYSRETAQKVIEEAKRKGMSIDALIDVLKLMQSGKMTIKDFTKSIELSEDKTPIKDKRKTEDCQKIVTEDQLSEYLSKGWKVTAVLSSGKIVISNE